MTPKEKAEELFTTYRFSLSIPNAPLGDLKDSIAKQCALIAVDEVIASNTNVTGQTINGDYWQEVKQEIENLKNQREMKIELKAYDHTCADGCCYTTGYDVFIDGEKIGSTIGDYAYQLVEILNEYFNTKEK